jgi:hypothetical protein
METLKAYIRRYQPLNENGQNIRYEGTNPNTLSVVLGNVDFNDYFEVTKDLITDEPITFSFRIKNADGGKGTSGVEAGSSSEITFIGEAAKFIQDWLKESVSAHLNAIEIKFVDVRTGTEYPDWIVYNSGLKDCEDDEECMIKVNLRQRNEVYECIQRTSITDNHLGWFQPGTDKHLLFDYCNDFRPAFILTFMLFTFSFQYFTLFVILAPVIFIIQTIVGALNAIIRFFGGRPINNPITFSNAIELYHRMIRLMAGCGRRYIGVLYRDYITNVCTKCGVTVNEISFPVLYDPASPYYNKVMISHTVKKGVDEFGTPVRWIADNDPLMFLDQLLDELKETFNSKWFIKNNILYFDRKDKVNSSLIFNFEGEDKELIIDKPCFTWDEQNSPAYARCEYGRDGLDAQGNEAYHRFCTLVEYNKPQNPSFKGELRKQLYNYGANRFRTDGIDKDYLEKALEPLKAISLASLILIPIYNQIRMSVIGLTGALIVQNDTTSLKKALIWDGVSRDHARTKWIYSYGSGMQPPPNPIYNKNGGSYHSYHSEDVQYDSFEKISTRLYNYDLAFEEMFLNNLYDRFHQIDDPRLKGSFYKKWELTMQNCEQILKRMGLEQNATNILLENEVLLNGGRFYKRGIIEEFVVEYYSKDIKGDLITLKGRI